MGLFLQSDFFDHLSEKRIDVAMRIFSEDCVLYFPGIPEMVGRRRVHFIMNRIRARFSEIRWQVDLETDILIDSRFRGCWVHYFVNGTYISGNIYKNEGVSLITLTDDGRVRTLKDFFISTDFSDITESART